MKHTKRLLTICTAVALVLVCGVTFAACSSSKGDIKNGTYTISVVEYEGKRIELPAAPVYPKAPAYVAPVNSDKEEYNVGEWSAYATNNSIDATKKTEAEYLTSVGITSESTAHATAMAKANYKGYVLAWDAAKAEYDYKKAIYDDHANCLAAYRAYLVADANWEQDTDRIAYTYKTDLYTAAKAAGLDIVTANFVAEELADSSFYNWEIKIKGNRYETTITTMSGDVAHISEGKYKVVDGWIFMADHDFESVDWDRNGMKFDDGKIILVFDL